MRRTSLRRRRSYRRTRRPNTRIVRRKYNGRRRTRRTKPLCTTTKRNIKLRYVETTNVSFGASGTVHYAQYKLNSAYDVSSALSNTAMPGFDEWKTMYSRYKVNMAVMKCTFYNPSVIPCYVGMWAAPESQANITTWAAFMELKGNPWCKRALLGAQGSGNDRITMSLVVPLAKIWGNSPQYKADKDFTALTTTNPSQIIPGYIFNLGPDAASNTGVIYYDFTLTMYITMYDRIILLS